MIAAKAELIPPFVIEAVNTLLSKRFNGSSCTIYQHEIVDLAIEIGTARSAIPSFVTPQTFYDEHWLDFEPIYQKAGWKVVYDKPSWDESFRPFFKFSRAE